MFWNMRRPILLLSAVLLLLTIHSAFCAESEKPGGKANPDPESAKPAEPPLPEEEYLVSPKDVLEITIVGEKDLPVYYTVSDKDGTINFPYIGYMPVAGKTVKEIEKLITERLKPDWFVDPQVNVRVFVYSEKFVYVQGQVKGPGKHSFSGKNRLTVYRAIIMAGGFTDKAAESRVRLTTTDGKGKPVIQIIDVSQIMKRNPELDPPVKADDIIFVPESFL